MKRLRNLISIVLQCVAMPLPWHLRRLILSVIFGYQINPTSRIGLSLVLARNVSLSAGATIGHGTLIRRLQRLEMGEGAHIGDLNWISGVGIGSDFFRDEPDRQPALILGEHAAITQRHRIDATNTVTIGPFSTIAGAGSQILSHGIDLKHNRQASAPVSVGPYCFVGSRSVLVKGAALPGFSVLGAGSVLVRAEKSSFCLYSGVPAVKVRDLDPNYAYFHRRTGRVV